MIAQHQQKWITPFTHSLAQNACDTATFLLVLTQIMNYCCNLGDGYVT